MFETDSNVELVDLFDQMVLNEKGFEPEKDQGKPGAFSYTRGMYPCLYRANQRLTGQYAGFGNLEVTNERF